MRLLLKNPSGDFQQPAKLRVRIQALPLNVTHHLAEERSQPTRLALGTFHLPRVSVATLYQQREF